MSCLFCKAKARAIRKKLKVRKFLAFF